jgi:3-hydroxybutyryl-CoA dehydrogenase
MAEIRKVAVVGAGTMGNGIVHVFAQHGYDVTMVDVQQEALDRAMRTISGNLDRQVKKGTLSEEEKEGGARPHPVARPQLDGLGDAQLIVEAATENRDLKFRIFQEMDRVAGEDAILATNTSSISITEIAGRTRAPGAGDRDALHEPGPGHEAGGDHPRPRHLRRGDRGVVTRTAEALGKTVAEAQDYPGFVSNRILMPMINEAVFCLMEGVAETEAIDTVMKLGMNHPMGPLALADLIGLDTCLAIMEVLHDGLGDDKYRPCPLLRKYVPRGSWGARRGRGSTSIERR